MSPDFLLLLLLLSRLGSQYALFDAEESSWDTDTVQSIRRVMGEGGKGKITSGARLSVLGKYRETWTDRSVHSLVADELTQEST